MRVLISDYGKAEKDSFLLTDWQYLLFEGDLLLGLLWKGIEELGGRVESHL